MDWFERLTGFREGGYEETRAKLKIKDGRLYSLVNGQSYAIGKLELASLQELRDRTATDRRNGPLKVASVQGDVRRLHQLPDHAGALFQVASQFNLLEMIGPNKTPEHGVTIYQNDPTQGPACAIAAGAATIYRNYFAPVGGQIGQTAKTQIDALAPLGESLSKALNQPVSALWTMQNGYALFSKKGVEQIAMHLSSLDEAGRDTLRAKLCIGLHWDVEVTDSAKAPSPVVSQAFCSALPISYNHATSRTAPDWEPFAQLVLDASYEATLHAATLNARRGASNIVLLTALGGGAFGNDEAWILEAMRRAFRLAAGTGLDVKVVSYAEPSRGLSSLIREFS
jgi:hypothetical protein